MQKSNYMMRILFHLLFWANEMTNISQLQQGLQTQENAHMPLNTVWASILCQNTSFCFLCDLSVPMLHHEDTYSRPPQNLWPLSDSGELWHCLRSSLGAHWCSVLMECSMQIESIAINTHTILVNEIIMCGRVDLGGDRGKAGLEYGQITLHQILN